MPFPRMRSPCKSGSILVIKGGNFGPGRGEFWSKSVFFGVRTKVSKVCSEILHYFQGGQRGIIYAGG